MSSGANGWDAVQSDDDSEGTVNDDTLQPHTEYTSINLFVFLTKSPAAARPVHPAYAQQQARRTQEQPIFMQGRSPPFGPGYRPHAPPISAMAYSPGMSIDVIDAIARSV